MDVLEEQDCRRCGRKPLEEHAGRREQVLLVTGRRLLEPQEMCETGLDETAFLRIRQVLLDCRSQLGARGRCFLVFEDAGPSADHLCKSPKRHAVAVGEAAARMPPHSLGQAVDVLLELPREAGLADTADPDDRHEEGSSVLRTRVEELLDEA